MSNPHEREQAHRLDVLWGGLNFQIPSAQFAALTGNMEERGFDTSLDTDWDAPLAINMIYQGGLCHHMHVPFGTANHAMDVALIPSTAAVGGQLTEAHTSMARARVAHSCLAPVPCQWSGSGSSEACGSQITCKSISAHFGEAHGIKNLGRDALILCLWQGCPKRIKRNNFVRHIRECHLDHPRNS